VDRPSFSPFERRCYAGRTMSERSDARWRSIGRSLQIVGGVCFVAFFLSLLILVLAYYPSHRPEVPQPEQGLTAGLTWTDPVRYGTERDERCSQWLFGLIFPSFVLMISGELIKIYKLGDYSGLRHRRNPPWNQQWGP
jgi:hypothetical protein